MEKPGIAVMLISAENLGQLGLKGPIMENSGKISRP